MKNTFIAFAAMALIYGCANKKAQKKAIVDSVMQIHEKVMGADEELMKNKLLLDSAVKSNSTAGIKDSVQKHLALVTKADSAMSDWMHKFDYEQKGKSEDEVIIYMKDQKKKINYIDSLINAEVAQSNNYLKKIKLK